jgi:hypothetical protein
LIQAWTARVCQAGEGGGTLGLRRRCHGGSLESGQPAAMELSLLRGFALWDRGRRGGPVAPTSGKRQEVEAVGIDRAAWAELGVIGGGLRWGSDLIFFGYDGGEA